MAGRLLAVGDVHGCAAALRLLLTQLQVRPEDTLVFVGDLVDKGEDSRSVVEQILSLTCRVVVVMGNHDQALLDALDRRAAGVREWEGLEQFKTFQSYGGVEHIPAEHIQFLRSAVPWWQIDGQIFVHANLEPGVPLPDQERGWLQLRYLRGHEAPYAADQRVICGHTIQNSGVPWVLDGWVCIDTAAFHGGWLTCLDVHADTLVQTSEAAQIRSGTLAELGRHEPRRARPITADGAPSSRGPPPNTAATTLVIVLLSLAIAGTAIFLALMLRG